MKTKLTPKAGYSVIDPIAKDVIPASGREVELDSYWLRRLRDGDVTMNDSSQNKPEIKTANSASQSTN